MSERRVDFAEVHRGGAYNAQLDVPVPTSDEMAAPPADHTQDRRTRLTTEPVPRFADEVARVARQSAAREQAGLTAWQRHVKFVNDYKLFYAHGRPIEPPPRRRFVTDNDVLRENYRFIRTLEDDAPNTWEVRFAKKYYEKLFKEYALVDLSRFKEGKIGLRWRVEKEVLEGKGHFMCGNKSCHDTAELRSYEVNFKYNEGGEKKNALVKLRLCPKCAYKLNYRQILKMERRRAKELRSKERKRKKKGEKEEEEEQKKKRRTERRKEQSVHDSTAEESDDEESLLAVDKAVEEAMEQREKEAALGVHVSYEKDEEENPWTRPPEIEKSKEDEFEAYFEARVSDLFL